MKFLQLSLLFVALFAFASAANSTWGRRNGTDYMLMNEVVRRNGVAGSYISTEIQFPKPGQTNVRTITAIYVYDRYPNGRGAVASLWSGGPGYRFATISFKSQYGQGINSTVQIYGR